MIRRTYFTLKEAGIDLRKISDAVEPEELELISLLETKHANDWVIYTDQDILWGTDLPEASIDAKKKADWENKFQYIYRITYEKYIRLIKLFKEHESHLMDKLERSTVNKFNDTPQNVNVGDTDEYTSSISKTSTLIDPNEVVNRLENIRKNYKNIYIDWIKEFDAIFGNNTLI